MRDPLATFGSDGWVLPPDGPLAEGKPHPRCYDAYPRILGHYVREAGVLTLEAAVHKADGIAHVLVAGEAAVRDGQPTGARAGRVLRRP